MTVQQQINNTEASPLHSVEAEQMVLGALLFGQSTAEVEARGGVGLFVDPIHQSVYQTCRELENSDRPVSHITVAAMLSDEMRQSLAHLGGTAYLLNMARSAVATEMLPDYAALLAEAAAKRRLIEALDGANADIATGRLNAAQVAARLDVGLQALDTPSASARPVSFAEALGDALEDARSAYVGDDRPLVRSGIHSLDKLVAGFGAGSLWLIGGRPSMGKSACALSVALNAAREGHHVVIASLEMTPKSMALRALSEATSRERCATAYSSIASGEFDETKLDAIKSAAAKIAHLPITFLPPEYQDADLLQAGVKQSLRRVSREKMPLVVVDYAQLMRSRAPTRYEQITDISLALKGMAMRLQVPVIALSQLSRRLEERDDKRPMMSDLRESGQLEQDADGVIFCYRDEYYLERENSKVKSPEALEALQAKREAVRNRLELIVAKQRQGKIGTAHVKFNPSLNLIWEDSF